MKQGFKKKTLIDTKPIGSKNALVERNPELARMKDKISNNSTVTYILWLKNLGYVESNLYCN